MNLQPIVFATLFGCVYFPKTFASETFDGKYSKLTEGNLRRRIQSIEERNRGESIQKTSKLNQESRTSNRKSGGRNPQKERLITEGEGANVLELSRNQKTAYSSRTLENTKEKSPLLEVESSSTRESPKNPKMRRQPTSPSQHSSCIINTLSNRLSASHLFKPTTNRFLDSKKLVDLYEKWNREGFYYLDIEKILNQIEENLKKCEISQETKQLFQMETGEISQTEEEKRRRLVTINYICDRIAKKFRRKNEGSEGSIGDEPKGKVSVELGFTGMTKDATYYGKCYKIFKHLNIYLGPRVDDEQFYFVGITNGNTYRVMDSLRTKEGGKKRLFQKILQLWKSIEDYYYFQQEVEKKNLAISYTSADKKRAIVPGTSFPMDRKKQPSKELREIFLALSTSKQPDIDLREDNETLLDEICREISTLTSDLKYNSHYGDRFVYHGSEFLQGRLSVHHTIRLYDSIDTVQNILLFGKCYFQKHKEVIYVYLATKKDYEEKYLLAIKEKDGETVAVNSLQADVTTKEVYF